jgi:hypothetical protein
MCGLIPPPPYHDTDTCDRCGAPAWLHDDGECPPPLVWANIKKGADMTSEEAYDALYHAGLNSNRVRFVGRPVGQVLGACKIIYIADDGEELTALTNGTRMIPLARRVVDELPHLFAFPTCHRCGDSGTTTIGDHEAWCDCDTGRRLDSIPW